MAYPMSSFGSFPIESLSVTCSPGADLNAGGSLMWLNMTVKTKGQWYSNGRPMFYCALLANPEGVDVTLLDRVTTGQLVSKPMVRSDQTLKPEVQIKFTCDTGTNNNECQYTRPTIQWIVGQKEITEGVVNNPVDCGGNPPKYRTSSDINISGDQFNGVQDVKCVVKMKDRIDESATKTITVKFPEAKTGAVDGLSNMKLIAIIIGTAAGVAIVTSIIVAIVLHLRKQKLSSTNDLCMSQKGKKMRKAYVSEMETPQEQTASVEEAYFHDIVSATTLFAERLYSRIAMINTDSMILFSPFAVMNMMSAISTGARNATADELEKTIRINAVKNLDLKFESLNRLINRNPNNRNYTYKLAQGMFVAATTELTPAFKSSAQRNYRIYVRSVDYRDGNRHDVRHEVNEWCRNAAGIDNVVDVDDIHADVSMLLITAMYVHATFRKTDVDRVSTMPFSFPDSDVPTDVHATHLLGSFLVGFDHGLNCQVLDIPLDNSPLTLCILLPDKSESLNDVERRIINGEISDKLSSVTNNLSYRQSSIYIPDIHLSYAIDLETYLSGLGLVGALTDEADLSAMTTVVDMGDDEETGNQSNRNDNNNLRLSHYIHSLHFDVCDKNTKPQEERFDEDDVEYVLVYRVDRPFMFVVRHPITKEIVIMGRSGELISKDRIAYHQTTL
ncbi:leukocyte elastase inhibitor-like isoform X2 [Tubulanus polymorphus]